MFLDSDEPSTMAIFHFNLWSSTFKNRSKTEQINFVKRSTCSYWINLLNVLQFGKAVQLQIEIQKFFHLNENFLRSDMRLNIQSPNRQVHPNKFPFLFNHPFKSPDWRCSDPPTNLPDDAASLHIQICKIVPGTSRSKSSRLVKDHRRQKILFCQIVKAQSWLRSNSSIRHQSELAHPCRTRSSIVSGNERGHVSGIRERGVVVEIRIRRLVLG